MSTQVLLDYDDFFWKEPYNCLTSIDKLLNAIPSLKIMLFTIPYLNKLSLSDNLEWCNRVRYLIYNNSIRLAVHGTTHSYGEYAAASFESARKGILMSEASFERANLPFIKIFKAPHWQINMNTILALDSLQYKYVFVHPDFDCSKLTNLSIKPVAYTHNLKDNLHLDEFSVNRIHGHTHNVCGNGIEETADKLIQTINSYKNSIEFIFMET